MPNTHNTLTSLFNDIADAIREKDGTSENIVADTFPDRIAAIPVSTKTKFYIEAIENTTIALVKIGSPTTGTCTYGIDDESTPTSYTYGGNLSLNAGEKCYFSITSSSTAFSSAEYLKFTSTGNINAGGNISSLIGGDLTIPRNYCFHKLFTDCTKLISIQDLVLDPTTLTNYCYQQMFYGCTSLTSIPSNLLPATTLDYFCYNEMFYGCISLTNVPILPATTLANSCYRSMFRDCTSLTSIPSNLLPATTLANSCYANMFRDCTSLTNVPILPATTLATSCYEGMFSDCTSLTSIPSNLLPATTLNYSCYANMFRDCTSLTNVPNLPATTLATSCYQDMFYGCSKIKLSETQTGNYQTSFRIPTSGTGTSGTSGLVGMFTNTGGTFTGTPSINTTYYLWEYVNVDVSDTTATASDVLVGKYFYTSNGTKTAGTLTLQFRNFTYTLVKDESGEYQNSQDILMWLPTYNDDDQLTTFVGTDIEGETNNIPENFAKPVNKHCKLPVINGKCEVIFIATANVQLTDNASGCSLEGIEDPSGQLEWSSVYKLSILEDNANVEVIVLV